MLGNQGLKERLIRIGRYFIFYRIGTLDYGGWHRPKPLFMIVGTVGTVLLLSLIIYPQPDSLQGSAVPLLEPSFCQKQYSSLCIHLTKALGTLPINNKGNNWWIRIVSSCSFAFLFLLFPEPEYMKWPHCDIIRRPECLWNLSLGWLYDRNGFCNAMPRCHRPRFDSDLRSLWPQGKSPVLPFHLSLWSVKVKAKIPKKNKSFKKRNKLKSSWTLEIEL